MDIFNSAFNFFIDKSRGKASKVVLVIILFLIFLGADGLFSFSYYYNNSQKISQAKELTQILKEPNLSQEEVNKLSTLRKDIIDHTNLKDYLYSSFLNISFKSSNEKYTHKNNKPKPIVVRSYKWHFVTSSWIFIIIMVASPFVYFFSKNTSLGEWIAITTFAEVVLFFFAWIFAKVFSFIPLILNTPFYNYILNFILCGILFFSFTGLPQILKKT